MTNEDQTQAAAVENEAAGKGSLSQSELDELVASSDTGGRSPSAPVAKFITIVAIIWSLFQLWIASPLPFMLGFGVFNDTEARSFHLAFALFLAYAAYPAARTPFQLILGVGIPLLLAFLFVTGSGGLAEGWWIIVVAALVVAAILLGSPKEWVPPWEWALGIAGAVTALYIYFAYDGIATRVGAPITQDLVISVIGLILLLEATRRALGPALTIVASVFLAYTFLGPAMPSIIAHSAKSLALWPTTNGSPPRASSALRWACRPLSSSSSCSSARFSIRRARAITSSRSPLA